MDPTGYFNGWGYGGQDHPPIPYIDGGNSSGGFTPNWRRYVGGGSHSPGSGNPWSNNIRGEYGNFILRSPSAFDNLYGPGAWNVAYTVFNNAAARANWRSGKGSLAAGMWIMVPSDRIVGSNSYNRYTLQGTLTGVEIISRFVQFNAGTSGTVAAGGGVHDVSQAGLNFIAGYEGFSATTYKDVAGLPTIGYGHLIKSGESFGTLSNDAALKLLRKDASFAVNAVNKYVKVSLTQ
ncbi:MAG: lysozyme, partial [Candidatus Subteraquimicrobiales bacterium]|nr:lysozyme [Candidatus Subteraquimicrobiales bacterium]